MSHSGRRIAVFPGQFDPITKGHLDVIARGTALFDEVLVGVGINPEKKELFTLAERVKIIEQLLKDIPGARVAPFEGLTVDFVRASKATVILRGYGTCRICAMSFSWRWLTGRWGTWRRCLS